MLATEIPEFQAQLRTMFAGLAISAHDNPDRLTERVEAWTIGLRSMSLLQFTRAMEHLLAVPWPDSLPKKRPEMTATDMWKVVREMRGGRGDAADPSGSNSIRDYWRSAIVNAFARCLGYDAVSFEYVLVQHKDTLGVSMRKLLDELEQQDRRDGRTEGQHRYVQRMAESFARSTPALCTDRAPNLPPTPADAEPELAF